MRATRDSMLADPEKLIADLQRQLAECRAERDEALERETAIAEVLQVINSSPGDLTPVFDAILETAQCLCDAVRRRRADSWSHPPPRWGRAGVGVMRRTHQW